MIPKKLTKKEEKALYDKEYIKLNREKRNAYKKEWRKKNPQKAKDYYANVYKFKEDKERSADNRFKRVYGISLEDYKRMLILQEDRCLICKTHKSNLSKALAVDHDHITGKVRGLLCGHCNIAIGLLKEDISILKNCIMYLKRFENVNS